MTWDLLVLWFSGALLVTGLLEWAYQRWCRKHGIEITDIFG